MCDPTLARGRGRACRARERSVSLEAREGKQVREEEELLSSLSWEDRCTACRRGEQ